MKTKAMMYPLSLPALILVLVITSGCGSSGGDSTSAAAPLSKAAFIKQADAACKEMEKAKTQIVETAFRSAPTGGTPSKEHLATAIKTEVLPLYEELVGELDALQPPPNDEASVRRFVALYGVALRKAKGNPAALVQTDPFVKGNAAAGDYGIESCGL